LEGEGFLDAVDWTEVVVFYFAQLEEAKMKRRGVRICLGYVIYVVWGLEGHLLFAEFGGVVD
jgi:hypothetical protein